MPVVLVVAPVVGLVSYLRSKRTRVAPVRPCRRPPPPTDAQRADGAVVTIARQLTVADDAQENRA